MRLDFTRRAQGLYDKAQLKEEIDHRLGTVAKSIRWIPANLAPLLAGKLPDQAERITEDFIRDVLTKLSEGIDPTTGERFVDWKAET